MLIGVHRGSLLEGLGGHGEVLFLEHVPAPLKLLIQLGVGGLIAPSLSSFGGAQSDGGHDAGIPSSQALGPGAADVNDVFPDFFVVDEHRDLVSPDRNKVAIETPLLVRFGLNGFSGPP